MKKIILFFIYFCFLPFCFPETIELKNGKIIEGKLVEFSGDHIKVDTKGKIKKYYISEINSIIYPSADMQNKPDIKETITKTPQETAKEALAQGIEYGKQGSYNKAIAAFNKAIENDPNLTKAYYNRGLAYCLNGQYNEALNDCNKAIEMNSNIAEAYVNRGLTYYRKTNYDQAIKDFNKAIEINPNLTEAYANRQLAYYLTGAWDNAWKDVHKLESLGAKVNPDFLEKLKKASRRKN